MGSSFGCRRCRGCGAAGMSSALGGADREEGGGELGEDGAGGLGGAEVEVAELGHEGFEEGAAAVPEELRADGEVGGDRLVAEAPGGHLGDEREKLDRGLGEAVGGLLLVAGSGARVTRPTAMRCLRRAARMFEAMPSSEPARSSRKWRRLPNIMSRRTMRLQRSPMTSRVRLMGQPERPWSRIRGSLPLLLAK